MRSRYSAFVKTEIDYLRDTTWPPAQKHFDDAGYTARATNSIWIGLDIADKEAGGSNDAKGTVTFIARSMVNGNMLEHREKSLFKKKSGRWYYVRAIE